MQDCSVYISSHDLGGVRDALDTNNRRIVSPEQKDLFFHIDIPYKRYMIKLIGYGKIIEEAYSGADETLVHWRSIRPVQTVNPFLVTFQFFFRKVRLHISQTNVSIKSCSDQC